MRLALPTVCKYCGSESLRVSACELPNPHAARVDCESCNRFQKWLSKSLAAQIGLEVQK